MRALGVDNPKVAVVAIDCHRGHLDPLVATMPASPEVAERLTEANRQFFETCRALSIPIIHVVTRYREEAEIRMNPFWRMRADDPNATRKNVMRHNLFGSAGTAIMPGLLKVGDSVIDTKKRYDCFIGTDLEFRLKSLGINTIFMTGINTNSCVLATAIAANVRDYSVVVIEDCVDTMDTRDHHEAALLCLRTAFGVTMVAQEAVGIARQWQLEQQAGHQNGDAA
jgi:hypothetical protein